MAVRIPGPVHGFAQSIDRLGPYDGLFSIQLTGCSQGIVDEIVVVSELADPYVSEAHEFGFLRQGIVRIELPGRKLRRTQ
jgi:hypothetical protein